ncbi:MAG: hypothetical protein H6R17_4028 [Proteobacteria bacterium]|nr:hypothetical protein [Pseudomonadota bacterium]
MVYTCTVNTDLDDLIGTEYCDGQQAIFRYGPLTRAKKLGEELVLENSAVLSTLMVAKIRMMLGNTFIDDIAEEICPQAGFRLILR